MKLAREISSFISKIKKHPLRHSSFWFPFSYSFLLACVFLLISFHASARFEYTTNCQRAMEDILDLRMKSARELLATERRVHPDNGYSIYLEHYADVVELIVTDDSVLYLALMDAYEGRFREMDRLDDGGPYNEALQAEMLLYTGLAQVKYGSRMAGATKIYSAYRAAGSHFSDHPGLYQDLKLAGMFNIMMDFIPSSMRWIGAILGVSGDAEKGMEQLKESLALTKRTDGLGEEAVILITLGYKLTWQDKEAIRFLDDLDKPLTDNVLLKFLWASCASFAFENDLAVEKLMKVDRKKMQLTFPGMDYLAGRCLLNRLDIKANTYLERFIRDARGMDYQKDACNRLSYYYLLQGDLVKYEEYKTMVSATGQLLRDRDLEALQESKSPIVPHTGLLKARFLFDGGYFSRADSVMHAIPGGTLSLVPYQLEYSYRQGRIDQMLGRSDQASMELKKTVEEGASQPYTYATRAALQLGALYESKKDYPNALYWYKRCLEIYDEAHTVGSVKDKAEKGKKRMEGMM